MDEILDDEAELLVPFTGLVRFNSRSVYDSIMTLRDIIFSSF